MADNRRRRVDLTQPPDPIPDDSPPTNAELFAQRVFYDNVDQDGFVDVSDITPGYFAQLRAEAATNPLIAEFITTNPVDALNQVNRIEVGQALIRSRRSLGRLKARRFLPIVRPDGGRGRSTRGWVDASQPTQEIKKQASAHASSRMKNGIATTMWHAEALVMMRVADWEQIRGWAHQEVDDQINVRQRLTPLDPFITNGDDQKKKA